MVVVCWGKEGGRGPTAAKENERSGGSSEVMMRSCVRAVAWVDGGMRRWKIVPEITQKQANSMAGIGMSLWCVK